MNQLAAPASVSAPVQNVSSNALARISWKFGLKSFEKLACLLLFFALWEFLPRAGIVSAAFLSPPSDVFAAIVKLVQTGQLNKHIIASLQRSLAGLTLAVFFGVGLGLLMGVVRRFEAFVDPLLQLFRQV